MRILHTIYDHPDNPWVGGGGAIRALELNRRLVERGHEVTVLSGAFPEATDGSEAGIEFCFLGNPAGYLKSTFSFAYQANRFSRSRAHEYDVVVEDFAPWNPVFACCLHGTPSVLHVNHREGLNMLKRRPLAGWPFFLVEKFYPSRFRYVTALSEWTRKKINRPDAFVLPAGIGEDMVEEGARQALTTPRESIIVYIGRLEINNKGLDTLVEASGRLGDVRILLAGRGRDEQRLREMSRGLPVEFLGFVTEEEKRGLLKRAGALVLPSRFEGWGITVLEAAAFGTPVVVSDIPELAYSVDDGYGVSFRTGDPLDLADTLRALLGDTAAREAMGQRAFEAARRHTWDKVAGLYEEYLSGIMGGAGQ